MRQNQLVNSTNSPHRSFWLQDVLSTFSARPPLHGTRRADIVILGGGYVGLWTAFRIKEADPSCDVAIVEKDICGGGASGRNGGFALSWWPKISSLVKICGREAALQIARDSERAIQEIAEVCGEDGNEIDFKKSGWLWCATSQAQLNAWESVVRICESLGVDVFRRIPAAEIQRRSGSNIHREGVFDHTAAMLHPAKWVMKLRELCLKKKIEIYEGTPVLSFSRTDPVRIQTPQGEIIAKKLVIANNAWAAAIPELARAIVPITSDMIMSEPASEKIFKSGWTGGEGITDSQTMVDYYQVTKDQRVAFGKGGWGIAFGGRLGRNFDRNQARAKIVEKDFRRYYPNLKDIKITHDWCGPIDRTPNSLPLLGSFPKHPQILYGVGWSGNGVGPSGVGGRILAAMALEQKNQWSEYPLIGKSVGSFPPEPIRYVGAHFVRGAVATKERYEIEDQAPPQWAKLVSKLAPAGLEDKTPD